ncbi:hypothetical protein SAMN05216428_11335 [Nitrosospira sp. Nsp11]|nr:hypothetical protein SAMN05216315_1194 [Nitrosospira sp. Nsp18]SHM08480.1 hypothetical protein SAMN05216428_11335 [Nitrosospira sp. Nsp11]
MGRGHWQAAHGRAGAYGLAMAVTGFILMWKAALRPVWKRKFIHTTDSRDDLPVAENLLNRQFETDAPNQAWV